MRRCNIVLVVGFLTAALLAACDSSLPTQPDTASKAALHASVTQPWGAPGTLTLRNEACGCADEALEVRIDWMFAGTVECGAVREFVVPVDQFELHVAAAGAATRLTVPAATDAAAGVLLTLRCATP